MLLVLEDLGDKKNIEMGKFLDEEDGIEAVKALARLHAQFWNKPRPVCQKQAKFVDPFEG